MTTHQERASLVADARNMALACGWIDGLPGTADLLDRLATALEESATDAARLRKAVDSACEIIEAGDQRLLASDGPAGGQPPDLSLAEWRQMYVTLDAARASGAVPDEAAEETR